MAKLIMLVGPPGSGKSTLARKLVEQGFERFNQDEQGKGHLHDFDMAVFEGKDIVVDRMNFNKQQRSRYLDIAKQKGYFTEIRVLHESWQTCFDRIMKRENHETIKDEKNARAALQTFFTKYERPDLGEANLISFIYPDGPKEKIIVCDLDGTLCNIEHRRHHVRPPARNAMNSGVFDPSTMTIKIKPFKKNWKAFFDGIKDDTVNQWCASILRSMSEAGTQVVYCSGRSENERQATVEWLKKHNLASFNDGTCDWAPLYMRNRNDSRQDSIVKEIILDFELLTRYEPQFMIDDRKQVVEMWRRRGFTCLQCDEGDF